MNEKLVPQKYPRLFAGEAVGFLTALLWQKPKFSVAVTKKKKAVVFKLTVPVHKELQRSYPEIWHFFFGEGVDAWKKHLSTAYWNAAWGDKKLSISVGNQLRVVYKNALRAWFESYLRTSPDSNTKNEQLRAFDGSAQIKRLQPDPWIAMWVAWRFECLQPAINQLRIKLKKGPQRNVELLAPEIKAFLPTPVDFQRALGPISEEKGNAIADIFFTKLPDKEIAEAFIRCELEDSNRKLGKQSLKTYLRVGSKMRDSLADRLIY
jgi:hypothetical protein